MTAKRELQFYQMIFGLMLMGMIVGWVVVMQRLVKSDVEVAQAQALRAEERHLREIVERFYGRAVTTSDLTEEWFKEAVLSDRLAGVWSGDRANKEGETGVLAWPEGVEIGTSVDLETFRDQLEWGEVSEGRDRLGSLLLRIARAEGARFGAVDLLREGVWNYGDSGERMSPGFRLLLIRALEEREPTPELGRLKIAERIRAMEGEVEDLDIKLEKLVVDGMAFFFTKDQLESVFESEGVELSEMEPEQRNFVRVAGLKVWPYVSFTDGAALVSQAEETGEKMIYVVGISTVISTLGVVWLAIWFGRNELQSARARTDLAASVAHELRTPLAGQRVVLESMLEGETFNEEYLEMALRENLRLGNLAEEFLTFSRLERGVLELQLRSFSLMEVVEPMVDDFRQQHGDGVFELSGDTGAVVLADEAAVTTVVRNLIENAWKYSEGAKKVEVRVFEEGDEVGFSVKDEGVGLSAGELKKVFRQFYRVEKKLSRSQDGLGLGLSIVKRLVDAMEGRVEVESEVGNGSEFRVFLKKGGQR
ncbi:MAG: sensor histidine kinase [Verrucomicrobiaceae bacterium]